MAAWPAIRVSVAPPATGRLERRRNPPQQVVDGFEVGGGLSPLRREMAGHTAPQAADLERVRRPERQLRFRLGVLRPGHHRPDAFDQGGLQLLGREWQGRAAQDGEVDPNPADALAVSREISGQRRAVEPEHYQFGVDAGMQPGAETVRLHDRGAEAFGNEAGSAEWITQGGRQDVSRPGFVALQLGESTKVHIGPVGVVEPGDVDVVEPDHPAPLGGVVTGLQGASERAVDDRAGCRIEQILKGARRPAVRERHAGSSQAALSSPSSSMSERISPRAETRCRSTTAATSSGEADSKSSSSLSSSFSHTM